LGDHGAGFLAFPGGHLEKMESWEECLEREVWEETGLQVKLTPYDHQTKPFWVTNNLYSTLDKHFVTLWFKAEPILGTPIKPENREPHRCEGWEWYTLETLAQALSAEARKASEREGTHPALGWIPLDKLLWFRTKLGL
jgi:8-oxo-dGTP diphosphatase